MTKKLLVPYSSKTGPSKGRVFVAPVHDGNGGVTYVSMPGGKHVDCAMSTFVGVEVTVDEFMVRLVDSGFKILPSYDWQSEVVARYLAKVACVKVGSVVKLVPSSSSEIAFEILGNAKPDTKPKLP